MRVAALAKLPYNGRTLMRFLLKLRNLWPIVVAASIAACGFAAHPKSGAVACKPQGGACCPEGYVCVGRGTGTAGIVSPGTCWYKEDLPLPAMAAMHDYTPTIPNDPACLVTDWLPPGTGGDSGTLDDGAVDTAEAMKDTGVDLGNTADVGPDAPAVQDSASGAATDMGDTRGPDVVQDSGAATDMSDTRGPDVVQDSGAAMDSGDTGGPDLPVGRDSASDAATDSGDTGGPDAPSNLDLASEAGPVDTGTVKAVAPGIAASYDHSYAIVDGGLMAWGSNVVSPLGDGMPGEWRVPVQIIGPEAGVTAIFAGDNHTCAMVRAGLQCWGGNAYGQLGDNTTTDRQTPVPVLVVGAGVTAVGTGWEHTCVLINGGVKCWGSNTSYGALGNGTGKDSMVPVQVTGLTSGVTGLATGGGHNCAVVNGGVRCWGRNNVGQLGDNTTTQRETPTKVVGLQSGVTAIMAGVDHTCAVVGSGIRCWGDNLWGLLGDGTTTNRATPVQVVGISGNVTSLSANNFHTCAVVDGAARCWGDNGSGQLGNASEVGKISSSTPVQVTGLTSGVLSIAVGGCHTCARLVDSVKCWGANNRGQVGNGGGLDNILAPVDVLFP